MSDFEDPELGRALGRAGGAYPDVNLAYERLQVRVRRAQRRRATVVGSAMTALVVAIGLLVATRSNNAPEVQPSDRETFNGSSPDDTVDNTLDNTVDTTVDTTRDSTDNTTGHSTGDSTDSTSDSSDPSSSTPTTVGAPVTQTFSGVGGTITVRLQNNSLTLVSHSATGGFSAEIQHSSGDSVEVRFESESHETRIRVDLENGAMDPSIEEDES